jgi:uncharacterized protein YyaL (SSP411 family)
MNMSDSHQTPNRLIKASSPYLLQHAYNPVDWWEWSEEAFETAKREDKLVLVSIGYSACHWCHVMEREVFENDSIAEIMNSHFVCIKVDREERPDIDQIYMDAVQILTGRGGWPLNCFTLPDGKPLHGGTYFPAKEWEKLLLSLSDFYINNKEKAISYANDLTQGINKLDVFNEVDTHASLLSKNSIQELTEKWKDNIDYQFGGYNWQPKFPLPANFSYLLHYAHVLKDKEMSDAVHLTLNRMADGGIFDQIGGGFARYSTDLFWKVPHFEKMLYDNAQLMSLYAHAYQCNGLHKYKEVIHLIHQFVQTEMISSDNLFYSALDADSEGEEGKYYIWTKQELKEILKEDEPVFSLYYSVDEFGNWEHGRNILHKTRTDEELEELTGKTIQEIKRSVSHSAEKLLAERVKRIKPGLDDKAILSWNAMMVIGYADAYAALGEDVFLQTAIACTNSILRYFFNGTQYYRIVKNGKSHTPAFAEDYAALSLALTQMYEVTGNEIYIQKAKEVLDDSLRLFYSESKGLFLFSGKHNESLIASKVDFSDDVIPSANSMFAKCLFKLGYLFENENYHQIMNGMIKQVQVKIKSNILPYANWLDLLMSIHEGYRQIIICGEDKQSDKLWRKLLNSYMPSAIVIQVKSVSNIPLLRDKKVSEKALVYDCENKTCNLPQQVADIMNNYNEFLRNKL